MKRKHQFCPEGLNLLEDRVVMCSTGVKAAIGHALVVPSLSSKTLNTSLARIDKAFQVAMGNYQRAFQAAQKVAIQQGEVVALGRLAVVADRIGVQLTRQLEAAPYGMPYGARNISPDMVDIGDFVRTELQSVGSLTEAKATGVNIFRPAWQAARQTMVAIVRADLASGLYTFR
jgi:hypothetical protein